MIDSETNN